RFPEPASRRYIRVMPIRRPLVRLRGRLGFVISATGLLMLLLLRRRRRCGSLSLPGRRLDREGALFVIAPARPEKKPNVNLASTQHTHRTAISRNTHAAAHARARAKARKGSGATREGKSSHLRKSRSTAKHCTGLSRACG